MIHPSESRASEGIGPFGAAFYLLQHANPRHVAFSAPGNVADRYPYIRGVEEYFTQARGKRELAGGEGQPMLAGAELSLSRLALSWAGLAADEEARESTIGVFPHRALAAIALDFFRQETSASDGVAHVSFPPEYTDGNLLDRPFMQGILTMACANASQQLGSRPEAPTPYALAAILTPRFVIESFESIATTADINEAGDQSGQDQ